MVIEVVEAAYRDGHRVWLKFNDGLEGEVDLSPELWGEVFEPLRDPALFAQASIDPEWGTVVWSTGADLSPEFLHDPTVEATGSRS